VVRGMGNIGGTVALPPNKVSLTIIG